MGLFKSKDQKEVEIAVDYLNQFLVDQFNTWDKKLKLMIGAKAATENPLEKVEPFAQLVWIESYKFAIQLLIESEKTYEKVRIKTPLITNVIGHDEFINASRMQSRRIGESVGSVMREICDIKPDWYPHFAKHLEEPLMGELKQKAKDSLEQYLKENQNYYS